jgi:hypothetical protein
MLLLLLLLLGHTELASRQARRLTRSAVLALHTGGARL